MMERIFRTLILLAFLTSCGQHQTKMEECERESYCPLDDTSDPFAKEKKRGRKKELERSVQYYKEYLERYGK